MPKKVLFVITKSVWGGAQRYVYDLAMSLPKESYTPVVALGGNGPLKEKLQSAGIPTISIPSLERDISVFKELRSLWYLRDIFKKEQPDIVHLNSSKVGGLGALMARTVRFGIPQSRPKIIFTVHGWAFNESRKFIQKSAIYVLQWLTAALSDNIIVISRHDYRQAIQMPLIANEKFVLIPLGIPTIQLQFLPPKKARDSITKQFNIPSRKYTVGTIAELTNNKGLVHLIDGVVSIKNSFPDFRCLVMGGGEHHELLQKYIEECGVKSHVFLCGFVPNAAQYIKGFDVFLLPSLKEGLPYTILEALHAGVPVIASSVGGIPDLIEHEKSGLLVPPKNHVALGAAQKQLLASAKNRIAMGKHGKKRVEEKFPFDAMLRRTCALYN